MLSFISLLSLVSKPTGPNLFVIVYASGFVATVLTAYMTPQLSYTLLHLGYVDHMHMFV